MSAQKGFAPVVLLILIVAAILSVTGGIVFYTRQQQLQKSLEIKQQENVDLAKRLEEVSKELEELKAQDQVKINIELKEKIANVEKTYKQTVTTYEDINDLQKEGSKNTKLEEVLAQVINHLSELNYASGSALLTDLNNQIKTEHTKLAAATGGINVANVTASNIPPGSGYSRQLVKTDRGDFVVDIVASDLSSTRVVIDTAADDNCADNCPVLSVGDYAARSGAFAAINGTYFCPADYPSCAGKKNSYDLLVMNKNKKYFNSDNNVYSTNPAAIFSGGSARFVGRALEWGRDTGVDGVISNYPLLVSGSNNLFGGNDDPKQSSKGTRSFIASGGGKVYIGVCRNCSVADSATILKTMGMENAMNLDSGGSTALWTSGRYVAGPGRSVPNAVLFLRR